MHTLSQKQLYALYKLNVMGIQPPPMIAYQLLINGMVSKKSGDGVDYFYPTSRGTEVWLEYPANQLSIFPRAIKYQWNYYDEYRKRVLAQEKYFTQEFEAAE